MSFYTALMFYRPRKPPIVTANDLATVMLLLAETGKLNANDQCRAKVKFGESIDADNEETTRYEYTSTPGIMRVSEIEWDFKSPAAESMDRVIKALSRNLSPIYRANIFLGSPTSDVLEPVTRVRSPQNTIDFLPCDLSLEFGPIMAGQLSTEEPVQVGWISLSLSGSGYLYPWTLAEALDRASTSISIKTFTDVVRNMWPVQSEDPEPQIVALRRQIPDVWPYAADRPWDWFWGAQETG
jgi:hypothetical protein